MSEAVIIVTGMGRCGTTLMMSMLAAGGVPTVGNVPDYEVSEAMSGKIDATWLASCSGKAVKILDPHKHIWPGPTLRPPLLIIHMTRDHKQQAASILKFTKASGANVRDTRTARRALKSGLYHEAHRVDAAISSLRPIVRLDLQFEGLLADPAGSAQWLQGALCTQHSLDVAAAAKVVLPRSPDCMPDMRIEDDAIMRANMGAV